MANSKIKRAVGIPGTGALVEVDRIMNSSKYQPILKEKILKPSGFL